MFISKRKYNGLIKEHDELFKEMGELKIVNMQLQEENKELRLGQKSLMQEIEKLKK